MSRLNSKLVLKASMVTENTVQKEIFVIVKTVNTLEHGMPGDTLNRVAVDKILKAANSSRPGQGKLTMEFIK